MFLIAQRSLPVSANDLPTEDPIVTRAAPEANVSMVTVSLPTPIGQYFFNIRWGKERRSRERLAKAGDASTEKVSIFYTILLWNLLGLLGLGVTVAVYLLKSELGINLFESKSFLHDFIYPTP